MRSHVLHTRGSPTFCLWWGITIKSHVVTFFFWRWMNYCRRPAHLPGEARPLSPPEAPVSYTDVWSRRQASRNLREAKTVIFRGLYPWKIQTPCRPVQRGEQKDRNFSGVWNWAWATPRQTKRKLGFFCLVPRRSRIKPGIYPNTIDYRPLPDVTSPLVNWRAKQKKKITS